MTARDSTSDNQNVTRAESAISDLSARGGSQPGLWLMGVAAAAALAVSVYNYFAPVSLLAPTSSITGTGGALLVIVSTALLLLAAFVLGWWRRGDLVHWFFVIAALLGIVGTAFAGYMLDSLILVALMVVCLVGWLWFVTGGHRQPVSR